MKLTTRWTEQLQFQAEADGHAVGMDTKPPLGQDTALTPKQLLLAAACGCTGMDVAALMRKHRQPLTGLEIEADAALTEGAHPAVFRSLSLTFRFTGAVDPEKALEAVRLSQTRYCSVSAMLSRAFPISYHVLVNSVPAGSGEARFTEGEQK